MAAGRTTYGHLPMLQVGEAVEGAASGAEAADTGAPASGCRIPGKARALGLLLLGLVTISAVVVLASRGDAAKLELPQAPPPSRARHKPTRVPSYRHRRVMIAGVPVFVRDDRENEAVVSPVSLVEESAGGATAVPSEPRLETNKREVQSDPVYMREAHAGEKMRDWFIRLPPGWTTKRCKAMGVKLPEGCAGVIGHGDPDNKGLSFVCVRCTIKGLEAILSRHHKVKLAKDPHVFVEEEATLAAIPEIDLVEYHGEDAANSNRRGLLRTGGWTAFPGHDLADAELGVEEMDASNLDAVRARVVAEGYCGFSLRRGKAVLHSCHGGPIPERLQPTGGREEGREFHLYRPLGQAAQRRLNLVPWGLDRISQENLPLDGQALAGGGKGVHVYVMDSGIDTRHSDFGGRAVPTLEITGDSPIVCSPSDLTCAQDHDGHGTHCAGTIGGATYGVAKEVTLHAVKILSDNGEGSFFWFIRALDWITAHHEKPAVISASLGGRGSLHAVDTAIQVATEQGITVVVAAGNDALTDHPDACSYVPASAPFAIAVGATDKQDKRASWSNYGECVDILAPGTDILSATSGTVTGSASMSGTSMATPHVAGGVARILGENPDWTPRQVRWWLETHATIGHINDVKGSPNLLLKTAESANARTSITTTITTTTPNPVPCAEVIEARDIEGPCTLDEATCCVLSPNYPSDYGVDETCTITLKRLSVPGHIFTHGAFSTEADYDTLRVNGIKYHGVDSPDGVRPDPKTPITWKSDYSEVSSGWKLCFDEREISPKEVLPEVDRLQKVLDRLQNSLTSVQEKLTAIKTAAEDAMDVQNTTREG